MVQNKYAVKLAAQGKVIPGAGNFQSAAAARALSGNRPSPIKTAAAPGAVLTQERQQPIFNDSSRSNFLSKINTPYAQRQAAFQEKLGTYNDWSRGINDVLAAARKQRDLEAQRQFQQLNSKQQIKARVAGGQAALPTNYSPSRGWGGYQNGRIPASALASLSWAPQARLRSDAATAFERLNQAYRAEFGRNVSITDSYRNLAGQYSVARRKPGLAARPGTSDHGWGLALDLGGGINKVGTRQHQWLQQNAPRFGFINPPWARSAKRFEPWHWEYRG